MKVWPIDPLDPRNLRLEVPEKLPQGLTVFIIENINGFTYTMTSRGRPAIISDDLPSSVRCSSAGTSSSKVYY
jgi:hypothetical protein